VTERYGYNRVARQLVDAHTTRLIEPKRCFGFKYKLDAPVASFWGFGDELKVKLFFRS
jgi:hypothetical protein